MVDVVVDFSSEEGIEYYGEEAARRDIAIVSAVSNYSRAKVALLKRLSRRTAVLWSPNITIGINFLILAAKVLKDLRVSGPVSSHDSSTNAIIQRLKDRA